MQTAAAGLALQLKGQPGEAKDLLDDLGETDGEFAWSMMAAFTGAVVFAAAKLDMSPGNFCEQLAAFAATGDNPADPGHAGS